jgi:hypothetical protein
VGHQQGLIVVNDGKTYSPAGTTEVALLALGDYKAKLIEEEHNTNSESHRQHQLYFHDTSTMKLSVVCQGA